MAEFGTNMSCVKIGLPSYLIMYIYVYLFFILFSHSELCRKNSSSVYNSLESLERGDMVVNSNSHVVFLKNPRFISNRRYFRRRTKT